MPARNVTVTANFEPIPLDHFWCYWAEGLPPEEAEVQLEDQFLEPLFVESLNATVTWPYLFANPVEKVHDVTTPISNENNHLTVYNITCEEEPMLWEVTVKNQFGPNQWLLVEGPFWLAVPTQKLPHDPWECLDHFLVYRVIGWEDPYEPVPVLLSDQFSDFEPVEKWVSVPLYFANPVTKTHDDEVTDIEKGEHLVFYGMSGGYYATQIVVKNQFGEQPLYVYEHEGDILGVPSVKLNWSGPHY
jgi:hypothetical protein